MMTLTETAPPSTHQSKQHKCLNPSKSTAANNIVQPHESKRQKSDESDIINDLQERLTATLSEVAALLLRQTAYSDPSLLRLQGSPIVDGIDCR